MNQMEIEKVLYNVIILLFDLTDKYKSLDDKDFISYISKETGITKEYYMKLMFNK